MNWLTDVVRPKIQRVFNKKDIPSHLWKQCPSCNEMLFHQDLQDNWFVCSKCNHHLRMQARQRVDMLLDKGTMQVLPFAPPPKDPLHFKDQKRYTDRLKEANAKTQLEDSIFLVAGKMQEKPLVLAVQDFHFIGGSLGVGAGNAFIAGAQKAIKDRCPFVLVSASGGARMQEGVLSLMQMARTGAMVQQMQDAGVPYIVVLTDPTMGGVTASYAMLGDILIAEQGALIGFAGKRVIEQTIREELPVGFQKAEFLKSHGMLDIVVHRSLLKETLVRCLHHLSP